MFGCRRYIKIPNTEIEFFIIKKIGGSLPSCIGVNPADVLNYVIVKKEDDGYSHIDNAGESDGFETYRGAEQFLRAYVAANYELTPHRWYINEFPKNNNGKLVDNEGNEHDF